MDPTLLQHSSPFDFPISSESKYLGQGRPFSNPSYPANDFPYSGRRPQSALTNGAPGAGVAISSNSNLDFNSSSLLNESPWLSLTSLSPSLFILVNAASMVAILSPKLLPNATATLLATAGAGSGVFILGIER
ncbi:hypothetical protein ABEF94_013191 [Exophiala dermatitidis]